MSIKRIVELDIQINELKAQIAKDEGKQHQDGAYVQFIGCLVLLISGLVSDMTVWSTAGFVFGFALIWRGGRA